MEFKFENFLDIPEVACVYLIKSLRDDRVYVGSTTNAKQRASNHKSQLNCCRHDNQRLQNFKNKYGFDSLVFIVLEQCDKLELLSKEQYYIDNLKPSFNIILEATRGVGSLNTGICNGNSKLTECQVREIRNSNAKGKDLALKYSVSPSQISMVRNYKSYKNVKDELSK